MRYAQLVVGPAGSGKSTYCNTIVQHAEASHRTVQVVNLDPAAEYFAYNVFADIRELIEVDDVMTDETLNFGPNGGLIFCMKYFIEQIDWLQDQLGEDEDDYILFDCPGQIELYTHMDIFRQLVEALQNWNFRVCAVFLIDSQFMIEPSKFVSGVLTALSTMINLELPHVNILTKLDLLSKKAKEDIECFLESDVRLLVDKDSGSSHWNKKYYNLTKGIAKLIDDYGMVQFVPLDITDEESIGDVLLHIDNTIQYGEDLDVRPPPDIDVDDDDDGFASGPGDGGS